MNVFSTDNLTSASLPVIAQVPSVTSPAERGRPTSVPGLTALEVAVTKVLRQAIASGNAQRAWQVLGNGLPKCFGATGMAIGWQRPGQRRWLASVSGQTEFDRRSRLGRSVLAGCAETSLRRQILLWSKEENAPVPPTYRQLATEVEAARVVGFPLLDPGGEQGAAVILWGDRDLLTTATQVESLPELLAPLGGLVRLLDDATPSFWNSAAISVARTFSGYRRWLALGLILSLSALALIPVPDRVSCQATLQPQVRRYVVAPFDGTLEKSLVRAGDRVVAGQALARLDQRPLQMELTVLQGERDEAAKRRDAARAKGQAAAAQIAELEAEQMAGKIAHLQHHFQQLNITSPIDGLVVRGELERAEGAPVTRGANLFEIAPLSTLVAEVAIPEAEVQLVEPGMKVTLTPASAGIRRSGTIDRVHPRAEIRDGKNVFIADVILDNAGGSLRPGMQAEATVWSRSQPLGWTLVRRPYARLMRWMWW